MAEVPGKERTEWLEYLERRVRSCCNLWGYEFGAAGVSREEIMEWLENNLASNCGIEY